MRRRFLAAFAASTVLVAVGLVVLASPAGAEPQGLTAHATGAAEVPGPGDPDGHGDAVFAVEHNQLCYVATAVGITLPAAAMHIHIGDAGTPGDVVVPLDPAKLNSDTPTCTTIDETLGADIAAHPGHYYWNIHTSDFPSGAIRGQLAVLPEPVFLQAIGDGGQEVPGPGDPDGTLKAQLLVDGDVGNLGQLCYQVDADKITLPAVAMHIHRGVAGEPGPVVVPLDASLVNDPDGECVSVDPALLAEIHDHPEHFYFNIHTSDFPNGAVRGQLAVAEIENPPGTATTSSTPAMATTVPVTAQLPQVVNSGSGGQAATSHSRAVAWGATLIAAGFVLALLSAIALKRRPTA